MPAMARKIMVESDRFGRSSQKSMGSKSLLPSSSSRTSSPLQYHHTSSINSSVGGEQGFGRSPLHFLHRHGRSKTVTPDPSFRMVDYSGDISEGQVGPVASYSQSPAVAGILYKWVNYGKGWRPRWFILQDGVLSYYKVHGPDKILFAPPHDHNINNHLKGVQIIGSESQRFMQRHQKINSSDAKPQKSFGKLHLKVSSIRESKDEKKFYIFTGTKTLHLRAITRDDRSSWLDALQSAKDLFPKGSEYSDLAFPIEEKVVSTEKLRSRLLKEGVCSEAIIDCEKIMLTEISELQDQIQYFQRNCRALLERLRHLEAENLELETTVIDKTPNHSNGGNQLRNDESGSESEDYAEKENGIEVESEEGDVYFDTHESLSVGSYRRQSHFDTSGVELSDADDTSVTSSLENGHAEDLNMEIIPLNYPSVKRRKKLPEPKDKEKSVSLWSLIKDNIGKDLTRVCLPVYFNEPVSSLQKCFEDLEYSYLLDQASEWGKRGNRLMRILNVAAFAASGYASTEDRNCKPFNPLLGETYEADFPDKGLRFFSEKVSHHPMIIACHCEGRGWKFWGDTTVKSKFWGRSIQLDPIGVLTLEFDDGEIFQWSKVTTSIYNLILGKLYVDHYGTMKIQGNRELSCRLKFKEQSIIDRNPHQVQGFVHDKSGQKLATVIGKWDESMHFVMGDAGAKPKGYDPMSEAIRIWKRNKPSKYPTRYNLTSFAITLNELTPGLKEKLPPTDSRLRPDQRHLENGEYDQAFTEKLRLEQMQRQARQLQERGWQPRWFCKEKGEDSYRYVGGYWEARENQNWSGCSDIFGPGFPTTPQE